jgi:DNA-binding NarL/FixJ family response regulator
MQGSAGFVVPRHQFQIHCSATGFIDVQLCLGHVARKGSQMVRRRIVSKSEGACRAPAGGSGGGLAAAESAYLRGRGARLPVLSQPCRKLTGREREVVRLLAEGFCSKEIAERLGIALGTVNTHRAHIMLKLQTHSIAHLIRYAVRNNLVVL